MKFLFTSDIHILHLLSKRKQVEKFFNSLKNKQAKFLVIAGDIVEARELIDTLNFLKDNIKLPVYFVLGNHDFYSGSIENVRESVRLHSPKNMTYLTQAKNPIYFKDIALIGHDGWYDCLAGNVNESNVFLNDFNYIYDLRNEYFISKHKAYNICTEQAKLSRDFLINNLYKAFKKKDKVILVTHVMPFEEACYHRGEKSNDSWLPFFCNITLGNSLKDIMKEYPDKYLTVLSGHIHSYHKSIISGNILSISCGSQYYEPEVIELEI